MSCQPILSHPSRAEASALRLCTASPHSVSALPYVQPSRALARRLTPRPSPMPESLRCPPQHVRIVILIRMQYQPACTPVSLSRL